MGIVGVCVLGFFFMRRGFGGVEEGRRSYLIL